VITGRLLGVGVGPGDPELLTLKAVRILNESPVIAYVSAGGRPSMARHIVAQYLPPGQLEINLTLPMQPMPEIAHAAYEEGAARIGAELERGRDVAVLCEGDPFIYGSFAQLFDRLGDRYPTEVVPGIASFTAAAAAARTPLVARTQTLMVLPATLPADELAAHLARADAAAILKLGRHFAKVREVIAELGLLDRAIYVEHASAARERVVPMADLAVHEAPYFSLLLLPTDRRS
jgi:precorrin-2/cobalt-factor-2 C20-methyltransferase